MPDGSDTAAMESTETTDGFDMDKAATEIGKDLGLGVEAAESEPETETPETEAPPAQAGPSTGSATVTPTSTPAPRQAPKTWPKDMHPYWEKTPKEVQAYWETREKQMLDGLTQYKEHASIGRDFAEVVGPYLPHLKAAGIEPRQMIGNLLNAHWRLTQGTTESRKAAYDQLGKDLGFVAADTAAPTDPTLKRLQDEVMEIRSGITAQQEALLAETRQKVSKEVEVFASDKAHPYFDDVADDIVARIRIGDDLATAYEKAVWANPVTRAKEIARLQTEERDKLKENARLAVLPKKKAASVNVHGEETRRAPTEPLGDLESTIRETLEAQRARTH